MTNTMVRTFAVAALSAGAMALGPAAQAAPSAGSPFAGKYTGPLPDAPSVGDFGSIAVSSGGAIAFSHAPADAGAWKFSGTVQHDGTFTVNGKVTFHFGFLQDVLPADAETSDSAERSPTGGAAKASIATTLYFQSTGTMARGADGNLHGTTTSGDSFVWRRK